jgi:hypothetical protein
MWHSELTLASPKKFYTDMAAVLIPLATFAGSIALGTQFVITCPCSRFEPLLGLASQLLLAAPFILLSVYLLLYRSKENHVPFRFTWQHHFTILQFIAAGIFIAAGFVLLGAALYTAQPRHALYGVLGLVLFSSVISVAIFAGIVMIVTPGTPIHDGHPHHWVWKDNTKDWEQKWGTFFSIGAIVIFFAELALAFALVGESSVHAVRQPVQFGCNPIQTYNTSVPLASLTTYSEITSCQKSYGIYTSPFGENSNTAPVQTVTALSVVTFSIPTPVVPTPSLTVTIDEVRGTPKTTVKPVVTVDVDVDWNMVCAGQSGGVDCTAFANVEIGTATPQM